jgi:Acetyltransferase (GNAT) domain
MITVRSPVPREEWRAVVAGDPAALPEHAPEWVDALCAVGPYSDASRLYTAPDGRQFVLPLVRRRGPAGIGGWLQSYPPSWGMGGLVGPGATPEVLSAVLHDLADLKVQRVGIRPDPRRWPDWSAALAGVGTRGLTLIERRAHVIDLTGGAEVAFSRLSKSARRGTRLAERAGVRVELDRSGALLEEYYRLYLTSVDRWAGQQHEPRALAQLRARRRDPLAKLRAMSDQLGKEFVVAMAYVDDQPAFGSITLLGQTAHDARAAMDTDRVAKTCAGDLVQWRTIQLACELGCAAYHLGESGRSASLAQYKEKFGAVPVDYAELRLERLPWTRADQTARTVVKRLIGFRDA